MKKLFGLIVLCASLFGFVSCLDDNSDSVWTFYNEPVIVQYVGEKAMLQTSYGRFSVPYLSDTIKSGDYLWADFIVNFDNQPNTSDTIATNLKYVKIRDHEDDNSVIIKSGDMTDDYNDSISTAVLYKNIIGNVLFFGFEQKAPKGQTYKYEIICNTDSLIEKDNKKWPVLYIKSMKTNQPSGNPTTIISHFGFDMSEFVSNYKEDSNNKLSLYIKYQNRTKNDTDFYKSFQTFPIIWQVQ